MQTTPITSETLPGLALRTRMALARVRKQLNSEVAAVEMESIWDDTFTAAYEAFQDGNYRASELISEDPLLASAWQAGLKTAATDLLDQSPF